MTAGLRKIMTMKLFRTALLALALFSSCCAGDNPETQSPSNSPSRTETTKAISTTRPADTRTSAMTSSTSQPPLKTTTGVAGSPPQHSVAPTPNANLTDSPDKNTVTTTRPDSQKNTTESLHTNSTEGERINSTANKDQETKSDSFHPSTNTAGGKDDSPYSGIILPVVIALIVISLVVFLLMALYKICLKTTPERQENGTEQAPLDKENVKLISVKTTSPETGEQSSQGKNKSQQRNDSSSHLGNKRV